MLTRTNLMAKNLSKAMVRYHSHGGIPGENFPLDWNKRYKMTAIFTTYMVMGFGLPYLMVRHQLLKK